MTTLNRLTIVLLTAGLAVFGTPAFAGEENPTDKTAQPTDEITNPVTDESAKTADEIANPTETDESGKTIEDGAKPSFETVDSNLDGVITPDEAEGSWLAAKFADVDSNEDGLINRSEYDTAMS